MKARMAALATTALLATATLGSSAHAQATSTCLDVTVTFRPPGVQAGAPYPCACGFVVTQRPTVAGIVFTINTSCFT